MKRFVDDNGRVFLLVPADVAPRLARPLRDAINEGKRNGIPARADVIAVVEDFERVSAEQVAEVVEQGRSAPRFRNVQRSVPARMMTTMSTAAAADQIGCTDRHVRGLLADRQLSGVKDGKAWRVDEQSLASFLSEREQHTEGPR